MTFHLIVKQQFRTLEIARCNTYIVLLAGKIELRQTPVYQPQLHAIITTASLTAAQYCNEHVCLSVFLSVCLHANPRNFIITQPASLCGNSHSATCHSAEMTFLSLPTELKLTLDLTTPEGCKAEMT